MNTSNEKLKVHDDSHARAILKGEMKKARENYILINKQFMIKFRKKKKSNKNFYELQCLVNDHGLSDTVFDKIVTKHSSKKEVSDYISLGWVSVDDYGVSYLKGERLYPVCCQSIDSTDPFAILAENNCNIRVLFYFTEHSLVRMMRRHSQYSISALVELIRENLDPKLFSNQINSLKCNDYVIVTGNAYCPLTHNGNGNPVIKTWIPRSSWTSSNEDKLSQLADLLLKINEIRIIPEEEFNRSVYLIAE